MYKASKKVYDHTWEIVAVNDDEELITIKYDDLNEDWANNITKYTDVQIEDLNHSEVQNMLNNLEETQWPKLVLEKDMITASDYLFNKGDDFY